MNDSILEVYRRLYAKFPNLILDIQSNSSTITYGGVFLFSSTGPQHVENSRIYLSGFETGLNMSKC